jgi:hypothetical protein
MQGLVFDPTDLAEDITPQAAHAALGARAYLRALLISLRLKDADLIRHVVLSTPAPEVCARPRSSSRVQYRTGGCTRTM